VFWPPETQAVLLVAAAGLALGIAAVAHRRRSVPGGVPFVWLKIAVAHWCVTSALHTLAGSIDAQVVWAKVQYLGIASVPPLWLLFTTSYARAPLGRQPARHAALWAIPVLTVILAATNQWHGWVWRGIEVADRGAVYRHGPWFWIAATYFYALVATGTLVLVRATRRFPLPYRRQTAALVAGAAVPWVGNAAYLSRLLPPGVDPTPLAFAASGLCLAWGMFRYQLFELVPVARDLLFDCMTDAVLVLDANRRIVDVNPAALRLPGGRRVEVGVAVDEAVTWWTEAAASARALDDGAVLLLPEAGGRSLEVRVTPVRGHARQFVGWLIVVGDITARVQAETARRALDEGRRAQAARETLNVLAGGLAHDLNNLLTGVLGNTEIVVTSLPAGSPLRANLAVVADAAQRAADLVARIRAASRDAPTTDGKVDVDTVVAEIVDVLATGGHPVVHRRTGSLPPVPGEAGQIRQAIANVVANALEASPPGVAITVETGVETLMAEDLATATIGQERRPGSYLYVEVRDRGAGLDEATAARIFDPFFSTRELGRGLGLAAVQGVVRSHDGALRVQSRHGHGTAFRLWFPVRSGTGRGRGEGEGRPTTAQ
jgi:signal transduction histidine kinase